MSRLYKACLLPVRYQHGCYREFPRHSSASERPTRILRELHWEKVSNQTSGYNRYFPPNKPERPWPLSNLFNCIFGVVDVFFFLSDISSLESLTPEILFFQSLCWFDEIFDTLQAMCHGCDYYVIIECAQTICAPLFQNAQYGLIFGGWNRHCACAQR